MSLAEVPFETVQKWQEIVNTIAELMHVPSALVKPDGMGIGLAVSRTIIESHGGQLRALPDVSKGAVFQFRLPTNDAVSG
jgi:K+-sensing histidine kinase KdpD